MRAVGAVAGDIAKDKAGVIGVQRGRIQPHARRRTGGEVLDEHIRGGGQLAQRGQPRRVLEIQCQAFLGPVGPGEMRGDTARTGVIGAGEIAGTGAFHLDHACAQIGKLPRRKRRGNGLFQ